jgi:3-keto-5-aminohexanoate cleavage enzyme
MVGLKVTLRLRIPSGDAHYAADRVEGARVLTIFGDLAAELLIRLDGDEGLLRAYESVEFLAPVFGGDYIEATAELVSVEETARRMRFEARTVITNTRQPGVARSAADPVDPPLLVCRAVGTCVVPRPLQRRPRELYMPGLPAGPAPAPGPIVTPSPEGPRDE